MGRVIALALGLALVRRTRSLGARSLLVGICLGCLVEVVHDGDVDVDEEERKMKRRRTACEE